MENETHFRYITCCLFQTILATARISVCDGTTSDLCLLLSVVIDNKIFIKEHKDLKRFQTEINIMQYALNLLLQFLIKLQKRRKNLTT